MDIAKVCNAQRSPTTRHWRPASTLEGYQPPNKKRQESRRVTQYDPWDWYILPTFINKNQLRFDIYIPYVDPVGHVFLSLGQKTNS